MNQDLPAITLAAMTAHDAFAASLDAHALDRKLTALAATVCPHDPRTAVERRADALGALAADAKRLGCRCGRADCAAGTRAPAGPVAIAVSSAEMAIDGCVAPVTSLACAGMVGASSKSDNPRAAMVCIIHLHRPHA